MGSYRSEPETTKITYEMSSIDHSYASVHMCGNFPFIQDGGNLWKTQVSLSHPSPTGTIHSSLFSMVMEVDLCLIRTLSRTIRPEKISTRTREELKSKESKILGSTQVNIPENG